MVEVCSDCLFSFLSEITTTSCFEVARVRLVNTISLEIILPVQCNIYGSITYYLLFGCSTIRISQSKHNEIQVGMKQFTLKIATTSSAPDFAEKLDNLPHSFLYFIDNFYYVPFGTNLSL